MPINALRHFAGLSRLVRLFPRRNSRRSNRKFAAAIEPCEPRIMLTTTVALHLQNFIPTSGATLSGTVYASMYGQVGSTLESLSWNNSTGAVTETPVQTILSSQTVSVSASGTAGQNVITVADATGIKVGMGAFGGIKNGEALGNSAKVTAISGKQVTLSVPNLVSFNSSSTTPAGGPVVFSPFLPDQAVVQPLTILLPGNVELTSVRMVFTVGVHAYLAINSNSTVAPPDTNTLAKVPYDFVEFTLNVSNGTPSKMNINTSTVDQFGFPIQVTAVPVDPNVPNGVGVNVSRDSVFSAYSTYVAQDTNAQKVFGDLATVEAPQRILSPKDRIQLAGAPAAMKTYFDSSIKSFFDLYTTQTLTMFNVGGADNSGIGGNTNLHDLQGGTKTLSNGQRVLQLTDVTPGSGVTGKGNVYTVYEPFFSTNGYSTYPAPPSWLSGIKESPGQMVFATDGVFADNVGQYPNSNQSGQSTLLGAIENQIVTAFNRGVALNSYQDWVYNRTVSLNVPATGAAGSKSVTLATSIVTIVPGMGVTGTGIAAGSVVSSVNGTAVVLSKSNSGAVSGQLVFSYAHIPNPFYNPSDSANPGKIWNWYSAFLHQTSISIDGLAYGFGYDDQGGFSSFFVSGIPGQNTPQSVNIVLGTADQVAPKIVSFNRSSPAGEFTNQTSVTFLVKFSEKVTGVNMNVNSNFILRGTAIVGAAVGTPTTSDGGLSWKIPVTGLSSSAAGTVQVQQFHSTGITDLAGNALTGTWTGPAYTLDHTPPAIVAFQRLSPTSPTTAATSVTFLLTFSEKVIGVDTHAAADFSLFAPATAGGTIDTPTTSNGGLTWAIAVTGLSSSANGSVQVHFGHNTGITDLAGNALTGGTWTSQPYTLKHTAPAAKPLNASLANDYWMALAANLTGITHEDISACQNF